VSLGARQLIGQLTGDVKRNSELTRYAIQLLQLERKLSRNPAMLKRISEGIALARSRLEHFPMLHPNILAQLAELYSNTVSRLQPRIIVHGEPLHLQNPENVNRIRSLLLAGIRAAILWRQTGGSRWHLLFSRGRLLAEARALVGLP
jgi:high frequency lysogenization protein